VKKDGQKGKNPKLLAALVARNRSDGPRDRNPPPRKNQRVANGKGSEGKKKRGGESS